MIKKVFVGVLLAAAFGLLVFGAVNRTLAKGLDSEPLALSESAQAGNGGNGNGGNLNYQYQEQVLDGGVDDCIADGEAYGAGSGFGPGNADGNVEAPEDGTGYGYGSERGAGNQPEDAPLDGTGDGIADVDEWITVSGTVESVSSYEVIVNLSDGSVVTIDGRELSYLTELGFVAESGDSLTIVGFYEDGIFEVGRVDNTTSGQTTIIREDDGTPLWAGSGGVSSGSGRGFGGGGRR
jgi:hypothetical protein